MHSINRGSEILMLTANINKMDDLDKMDISPIDEKRCLAIIHVKHLRTLSDACLRLGIPPPMAAMHSRKAFTLLKVTVLCSCQK